MLLKVIFCQLEGMFLCKVSRLCRPQGSYGEERLVLEDGNSRDGWYGHQLGLEWNHRSCGWLALSVAVSVNTQLLRDLLAHSHWGLLVDFVADLFRNVLPTRVDN